MVRGFRLVNEKGQSYSLMDIENYCLLTDPSGLGYSYATEYEQLSNMFVENLRKFEQGQITGTVNCLKYDNFKDLVDFIEKAESLRIAYKVPFDKGEKEYLKDVNIKSLSKSQIQTTGVISETIVFDCLSLWYEETIAIYDMTEQDEEIRWDFKWDSKFTAYDIRSFDYINKGHIDASVEITIDGEVINPKIQLYIEGQLFQEISITDTIEEYEKLLYSSREGDFYIKKELVDGTYENMFNLSYIDFENDNVLRIPPNKDCTIRLTADEDIAKATITIFVYYISV